MEAKKAQRHGWSLRRMMGKDARPWRIIPAMFKRKGVDLQRAVVDGVVFKVVSAAEAVVTVSTLCFFLLCCGGHI